MARLEDEDKTTVELLQDAVEKLRADNTMLELRLSNLEYIVHELHQHVNDNDRHISFVEQTFTK